jgi:deoxyribodipyrimidine photo-lyase
VQCARQPDCDRWETLPAWARATLERHAGDPREHEYDLPQLEAARTHDPLWNAAQTQLVREGRMHNYLRMLWGKKILEWSPTPQEALARMLRLNDRWALDGRDPSSIAGAAWVLGRYDRAWGPERPEFGTIRYMSSANTLRKVRARETMRRYAP